MIVGVPKEIKVREYRVGLVPASVRELTSQGHKVLVETNAAQGIGVSDADYEAAGAIVVKTAAEVFEKAELVVKVKEPLAAERKLLRKGQVLFTYLHLAPDREQAEDLVASGATCIAYETVTSPSGGLPLLAPMSEVAGRMSIQAGAYFLEKAHGGLGMLLGGVPGVDPAKVVVLGGGVVGTHAVAIALGMGAEVWVLDRNMEALRNLWKQFGRPLNTVFSTRDAVEKHCLSADLVVGGVLIPGAAAPKLVTRDIVKRMKPGSVIVESTREAAARRPAPPPTTSPPTSWTASSTTASPTCRAGCRAPPPSRSTTPPSPSCRRSRTRAGRGRSRMTATCGTVSTCTRASSRTARSRRRWATTSSSRPRRSRGRARPPTSATERGGATSVAAGTSGRR